MNGINALGLSALQRRMLSEIYLHPGITRKELAASVGISEKSAIRHVISFLDGGQVVVRETRDSTGGRKSEALAVNPDWFTVLAADVGGYSTKIGVMKLGGDMLYSRTVTGQASGKLNEVSPSGLLRELRTAIAESGAEPIGLGLGVSGLIDCGAARIRYCPNVLGFQGVDAEREFGEPLRLPVYLETSARTLARAEQRFGRQRGDQPDGSGDMIYISVGHGISAGIIADGRVFRGSNGSAGEIGHIKCDPSGDLCTCGGRGCLELCATLPMINGIITRRAGAFYGYSPIKELCRDWSALTPEIVREALRRGDKIVSEVMEEAGRALGSAVAGYVNALNPSLVVFGGSVTELYPRVIDEAEREIGRECLSTLVSDLQITRTRLDPVKAAVSGAAMLVSDAFFGI